MSDRPLPHWGARARTICRRCWRMLGWVVLSLMTLRLALDLGLGFKTDRWLAEGWRAWVVVPVLLLPYGVLLAAAATWAAAALMTFVRPIRPADDAR